MSVPVGHRNIAGGWAGLGLDGKLVVAVIPAHASTHDAGGSDAMAINAAAGTGSLRTLGTSSTAAAAGDDKRFIVGLETQPRFGGPQGALGSGTLALVSGTAYFVYLGRAPATFTPAYVKGFCGSAGSGSQTAEIGLFSSPSGPNAAGQTLTKIEATGSITSLTGTGVKQNTGAFTTSVPAGTHLWAGIRVVMGTGQPTFNALNRDYARGSVLVTAGAGALTGSSSFSGSLVTASAATAEAPVLWYAPE